MFTDKRMVHIIILLLQIQLQCQNQFLRNPLQWREYRIVIIYKKKLHFCEIITKNVAFNLAGAEGLEPSARGFGGNVEFYLALRLLTDFGDLLPAAPLMLEELMLF